MKIPRLLTAVAVALFSSALTIETASAQTYTEPAPPPRGADNPSDSSERLAGDRNSTVYGQEDFVYLRTPDQNLFITRAFVSDLGDGATLGLGLQLDCGRVLFRHVIAPRAFIRGEDSGIQLEWNRDWLGFNQDVVEGQAMMRSCEDVAREEGMNWSWISR